MGKRLRNTCMSIFLIAAMVLTAAYPAIIVQADDEVSGEHIIDNISNSVGRQNYDKWASPIISYLEPLENGGLMSVQYGSDKDASGKAGTNKALLIGYYDYDASSDSYQYAPEKAKTIGLELPNFGAFYATDKYYFVLTGQNNKEQDPDKEVYRITRYNRDDQDRDKDWTEAVSVPLKNCNTTRPFAFGTARMESSGDYLLIRTCREMYKSSDGVCHQANITIQVNMEAMADSFKVGSGGGYVSHSFNQFVKAEDDHMVAIDQGDAYPRGIILNKYAFDWSGGKFGKGSGSNILKFKGNVGAIVTNATVGGLEISGSPYLTAGNSIDQDLSSTSSVRNIFVSSVDKNDPKVVNTFWLTNYTEEAKKTVTTPHLVRITDDEYLVLWQTKEDKDVIFCAKVNGRGQKLDENGNVVENTESVPPESHLVKLSGNLSDCVPVVKAASASGSSLMWSTVSPVSGTAIDLYRINTEDLAGAFTVTPSAITGSAIVETVVNPKYPPSDVTTLQNTSFDNDKEEPESPISSGGSSGSSSGGSSGSTIISTPMPVTTPEPTATPDPTTTPEPIITSEPATPEPEVTLGPEITPEPTLEPEPTQEPEDGVKVKVKSIKLSKTVYTYNGKAKKPSVVAMDTNGKRISGKYYTVSYKNNKKVGKATATITFKGTYSGTVKKKTFTIRPARTAIKKTTAVSKGFTVKWKKKTVQTSGYQIQYSTNSKFTGNSVKKVFVKKTSTAKKTVKNLKAKKKYYVRIRTYKKVMVDGKNKKIYSVWSASKKIQTLSASAK